MRQPTIRQATINDVSTIHLLGEHVDEFATGKETVNFWPESILQKGVKSDSVVIFVAEEKNEVVGFIIANCNNALSKALIENIYVNPSRRGQGTGTRLTLAAIDESKRRGCEYVAVLTPPDDTPAIKTYEKAGFTKGEAFLWLDFSQSKQFKQ